MPSSNTHFAFSLSTLPSLDIGISNERVCALLPGIVVVRVVICVVSSGENMGQVEMVRWEVWGVGSGFVRLVVRVHDEDEDRVDLEEGG